MITALMDAAILLAVIALGYMVIAGKGYGGS